MDDEIKSIRDKNTWTLTDLPPITKTLACRWVLVKKLKHDGIDKYKVRLVGKGYRQKEGIGYFVTFSPLTELTSIYKNDDGLSFYL